MEARSLILNENYDTAWNHWTLASCLVTKAEQIQSFIDVPGRYTPLDVSTYLTDGQPYYGNATLEAVLESSEGTHKDREERIFNMINELDGKNIKITLPDYQDWYMVGRVQIFRQYNDLAHCSVLLTAVCEPWMYYANEETSNLAVLSGTRTAVITYEGRLPVVPKVTLAAEATITFNGNTATLSAGTYVLPWLYLLPGENSITYSSSGQISFKYRKAVLAG